MRLRSMAIVTAVCAAAASAFLAGCGPDNTPTSDGPTTTPAAAATATQPTVKDLTSGNCTLYVKDDAVKLLGGVNVNNKVLDIGTDGGTKVDVCSYINLKGTGDLKGTSYAVVRYDSAATAFTEAQKVQTEMLSDAAEHQWPVQPLATPVPGAGQMLGGYGTKTDEGVTYTIAVVGTNVGPYLVTALGASTEGPSDAETVALTVFQALASAVG